MVANTATAQPPNVATEDKLPKLQLTNVFISYSRRNGRFVSDLVRWLKENNVQVWMDAKNIRIGKNWREQIVEGIRQSDQFLLVASPASRKSDDVLNELALAKDAGKPIVQIQYRKCNPFYDTVTAQYVDCTLVEEDGFRKLFYLEPLEKPWWRRALIFLKKYRLHFYILGALLVGGLAAPYVPPSKTTLGVPRADAQGLVFNAKNAGGRFSTINGQSFQIHFGKRFPIQPKQNLVLLHTDQSTRVWGHSYLPVRLKASDWWRAKEPDETKPDCYLTKGEVGKRLDGALGNELIQISVEVIEWDGEPHHVKAEVKAHDIKTFIMDAYPPNANCNNIDFPESDI